jgi:hypothetical protein
MGAVQRPLRWRKYDAPPVLERPGSHATHRSAAIAGAYEPALHASHDAWPLRGWDVPAAHGAQP